MKVEKEIERKWKIGDINAAYEAAYDGFMTMNKSGVKYQMIRQAYDSRGRVRWIHTNFYEDFIAGERTIKTGQGLERVEHTTDLTEKEVRDYFWNLYRTNTPYIYKVRCIIPHGKFKIEFDEILCVPTEMYRKYDLYAEIEFASVEEANAFTDVPSWFGEEVTGQDEHSMKNIHDMMRNCEERNIAPVYNEDEDDNDEGW